MILLEIYRESWFTLIKSKDVLLRVLLVPLICVISIGFFQNNLDREEFPGLPMVLSALSTFLQSYMAVAIHRAVIIGEGSLWPGIIGFKKEQIEYFGYVILLILISLPLPILLLILGISNPIVLVSIMALVLSYLFSRIALVLPSIATGKRISLKESWKITRKGHIQIYVLIGLPIVASGLFFLFPDVYWLKVLIGNALWIYFTVVLSVLYQRILKSSDQSLNPTPLTDARDAPQL